MKILMIAAALFLAACSTATTVQSIPGAASFQGAGEGVASE